MFKGLKQQPPPPRSAKEIAAQITIRDRNKRIITKALAETIEELTAQDPDTNNPALYGQIHGLFQVASTTMPNFFGDIPHMFKMMNLWERKCREGGMEMLTENVIVGQPEGEPAYIQNGTGD